jgi:hypothetical protein
MLVAVSGLGAAPPPISADLVPAALCIPILMDCSTPHPTPSPTSPAQNSQAPSPGAPTDGRSDAPGGAGSSDGDATPAQSPTPTPSKAVPDSNALVFTLPAAQLGGSSISFSGLQAVSVVTVPLADGTRTPVLKLVADDIAIDDFVLDVRKSTGPSLVSNATRMELHGHVQVYVDSVTAALQDGTTLTLGADTPPPGNELPPTMLRVNLGLVGVTADSIVFTSSHQNLKE